MGIFGGKQKLYNVIKMFYDKVQCKHPFGIRLQSPDKQKYRNSFSDERTYNWIKLVIDSVNRFKVF